MNARLTMAQRVGLKVALALETEFAHDRSKRPHDEHLRSELSDIALALDSLASELADDDSPLTDRIEAIAKQTRRLLAHVKRGEQ